MTAQELLTAQDNERPYIYALGNLPKEIKTEVLTLHVESAINEVDDKINEPEPETKTYAGYKEAVGCLALSKVIPVLNTFYLEGAADVQRRVGESDFVFTDVSDSQALAKQWQARASEIIESIREKQEKEAENEINEISPDLDFFAI